MSSEVEAGRALLAGFVSGAAAAFVTVAIALWSMSRSPRWRERAAGLERLSAPLLGVDTESVLNEVLGLEASRLDDLRQQGVS